MLAALAATAPVGAQGAGALRLEQVASYGWSDLADSTRPLSANDRRLQAGELGSVSGAIEGRNGEVFVLDNVNKKVAVFDKNGGYLRAFGGAGEGPGEFRIAGRIASGPAGSIYVWDPQLKRVTHFAADGKHLSQVTLANLQNAASFTVANQRAWFVRLRIGPGAAVMGVDLTSGMVVDSFAPLSEQEVSISGFGAPGAIASTAEGHVVYAGTVSGHLADPGRRKVTTSGSNRFPGLRGYESDDQVRRTPVSMRGFAIRPDGSYAALYSTSDVAPANLRPPQRFWLELLARDGTSLGRTELPQVESVSGVSAAANGDLLLSLTDEYPRVQRVRVSVVPKARGERQ